jgi:PilZ domain-containing protein
MGSQVRRCPRYPFYASAEILEVETQTRMNTRTSELSRYGCYLDMLNPLPLGTAVKIHILHNEQTFGTTGRVIYSQRNMGMGVAFNDMEAPQEQTLEKWLSHLRGS